MKHMIYYSRNIKRWKCNLNIITFSLLVANKQDVKRKREILLLDSISNNLNFDLNKNCLRDVL